ncbi:hypothetical protein [Sulfurimonas denitrificans]|jgi:hypothetical protein|uniref:hypothetical protein n=1 Tax=Sulfurimonas denitrificans TaxID=39766 RepID=UPI0002E022F9|nr:hypothetical protein [Sulfurimonas denitrificans]MDD3442044.1 hypothetical protein [Sulfurimonas denitrificans]
MKATFKRYALALFFLLAISLLMLLGTLGVEKLSSKMFEGTGVDIKPRGESLVK